MSQTNISFFSNKNELIDKCNVYKDQRIILIEDKNETNLALILSAFLHVETNLENIFFEKIRAVFIAGEYECFKAHSLLLKQINKPIYFIPTKLSSLLSFLEDAKTEKINIIVYQEILNLNAIEVSKVFSLITSKISVAENIMFENLFFKKQLPEEFYQYLSIVFKLVNGFKNGSNISKLTFFELVKNYINISENFYISESSLAKNATNIYSKLLKQDYYKEESELVFAYLISKLLKNFLEKAPFCEVGGVDFKKRYLNFKNLNTQEDKKLNFTYINENKLSIFKMKEIRQKLLNFYSFSCELLRQSFEAMKNIKEDNGFHFISNLQSVAIKEAINYCPDYTSFNVLTIMRNLGYLN